MILKAIILFILLIVITLVIGNQMMDYSEWNENFKDGYDEKHSLYLNYRELKHLYHLNPDRWFWERPLLGTNKRNEKGPLASRLFFDTADNPVHQQLAVNLNAPWYRKEYYRESVLRIYLTYPAYKLAFRMKKNEIDSTKKAALMETREKFIKVCQKDIDKLYKESQNLIQSATQETKAVLTRLNK